MKQPSIFPEFGIQFQYFNYESFPEKKNWIKFENKFEYINNWLKLVKIWLQLFISIFAEFAKTLIHIVTVPSKLLELPSTA